jgi:hypothetical protein
MCLLIDAVLPAAWVEGTAEPLRAKGGTPERGSAVADARSGRIANARVYTVPAAAA